MKISIKQLRSLIRETLVQEFGPLGGGLRRVRGGSGKQAFKIGKVEDENREISTMEAEDLFPGSVDAWCEVVPDLFPDYIWADEPMAIRKHTMWSKEGNVLKVSLDDAPQIELASWDPVIEDWRPASHVGSSEEEVA